MTGTALPLAAALALALLCAACSRPADDPVSQIAENVKAMETALAERDNSGFRRHLAASFLGGHRQRRDIGADQAGQMLAGYFLRYRNIGVLVTNLDIELDPLQPGLAQMHGTAALSGGNAALPETARLYRFSGQWQDFAGRWKLTAFNWE